MSSTSLSASNDSVATREQLVDQLQFLGQMLSTETALFHQAAAAKNGQTITGSKTISTLLQEGPMTAGQLSTRLSLSTGAITSVIDKLEECGAVHRVADPHDRRKVIVQPDLARLAAGGKVYDSIGEAFSRLLAGYTVTELEFLVRYHKAAVELTKQEIAKVSAGA